MTVLILAIIFTTQNLGLSSRITNQQWRLFINPLSLFYCNFTANDAGITYPNSSSDKGARSNSFNWARFDFIFITALGEVFLAYDSIIIREKKRLRILIRFDPFRGSSIVYIRNKKKTSDLSGHLGEWNPNRNSTYALLFYVFFFGSWFDNYLEKATSRGEWGKYIYKNKLYPNQVKKNIPKKEIIELNIWVLKLLCGWASWWS